MRSRERVIDEMLVLAAQARQVEAFEHLVERWHPRLLRHAWRLTGDREGAQEAVQDAWMAVVRGL
jgi:RNA polymerase sigma-70 factor (ECF subfamily)